MQHPILEMIDERRQGEPVGIPSFCTSNRQVLKTILKDSARNHRTVLIEATANQVDQFGGYTGMRPADYVQFIRELARETGCNMDQIILGGDHLGPLTFCKECEEQAMQKAEDLVREYAGAGFTKIHLDTSMKVADDPEGALDVAVCARRGARLCRVAEEAFAQRKLQFPQAQHPVYVIGSEVPVPGGETQQESSIAVTRPEDCRNTLNTYRQAFHEAGLDDAWKYVVALVVQPGVEYSDNGVFLYNRSDAAQLVQVLKDFPQLVFEGHSTDYQPETCLKQMVEDGIAILKVGPALTFAYREALFALSHIEKELIPECQRADFPRVLDQAMQDQPQNWEKYYHGSSQEQRISRSYSLSDRARYYMGVPEVSQAAEKLMQNLENQKIPVGLIYQYFPEFAEKALAEQKMPTAEDLLEQEIMYTVNQYMRAAQN